MATYVQAVPAMGDAQVRLGKIQRGHLSYIRLDESPKKLAARRDLEALVNEHLCSVPHKEKFTCPNFGDLIRRTIEDRPDFKASGAAQAFDALERYALNLIGQPWRQEYFTVRLYSGFFKHTLDHYLSNVEEILCLMGYERTDGMELQLNEPVDPDRVTDIALNCLIAAVECQIMIEILEKVGGNFTWKEIARARRHCTGGPEKVAAALMRGTAMGGKIGKGKSKLTAVSDCYQQSISSGQRSNGYVRVEKLVDVPGMWTDGGTLESDERYPYESSWERKSLSNGGGGGGGRQPIVGRSFDEDNEGALSLMHEDRRRSMQMDEDSSQTRADCWGFVDQSLERKGYNKDYGERGDLLKSATTTVATIINTPTTSKNKTPLSDQIPLNDYSPLVSSEYRNSPSYKYGVAATQKRPKLPQAVTYGRLPPYAKSTDLYGTGNVLSVRGMGIPPMVEPTVEDLIELRNPKSNLGFHPGMFKSPQLLRTINMPYVNPTPHPIQQPPPAQLYHPTYAAILRPNAAPPHHMTGTTPPSFYSSDRQHNVDLLSAVPPPPPPVKHSTPQDIIDALSNLQLAEDGLLPAPLMQGTGSETRDRKSKKSQTSSAEHRRSTYDNLQDDLEAGSVPSPAATSSSLNNPLSPPTPSPPPPLLSSSGKSIDKSAESRRSINDVTRDAQTSAPSSQRNAKADKASSCSKDVESDRLEVPAMSSRRSNSQSSSSGTLATLSRDQRGSSSCRESTPEKIRQSPALSTSSMKNIRHERSASVDSTRSSTNCPPTAKIIESSWECWACTYLNSSGRDVCEMCSRSRRKGAESDPLSSGGHECQNCTLVNKKGARRCSACNANLENSPTYV